MTVHLHILRGTSEIYSSVCSFVIYVADYMVRNVWAFVNSTIFFFQTKLYVPNDVDGTLFA